MYSPHVQMHSAIYLNHLTRGLSIYKDLCNQFMHHAKMTEHSDHFMLPTFNDGQYDEFTQI